jgi:hypothetical protein
MHPPNSGISIGLKSSEEISCQGNLIGTKLGQYK